MRDSSSIDCCVEYRHEHLLSFRQTFTLFFHFSEKITTLPCFIKCCKRRSRDVAVEALPSRVRHQKQCALRRKKHTDALGMEQRGNLMSPDISPAHAIFSRKKRNGNGSTNICCRKERSKEPFTSLLSQAFPLATLQASASRISSCNG